MNANDIAGIYSGGETEADTPKDRQLMEPEPKLGKGYDNYQRKRDELRQKLSASGDQETA